MIRISFLLASSLIISSHAAGKPAQSPNATITNTTATPPSNTTKPCGCNLTVSQDSKNSTYEEQILKEAKYGILHFSLRFESAVSNVTKSDKNVLFAPVSILGILATLLLGAESDSKSEILNLLGFSVGKDLTNKEDAIHQTLGNLFTNFSLEGNSNPAIKTELNQAIFFQNGTLIKDGFHKVAEQHYHNEFINADFSDPKSGAANLINSWASNRTKGRINEVVKSLSANTKLIILNTLFFNGEWEQPFFINSTWTDFYGENGTTKVKTMSNFGTIYTYDDPTRNFTVLGLPYKGGDTIMYIIYPDKKQNLKTVLSLLTEDDLHNIVQNAQKEDEVTYSLPYMNLKEQVALKSVLQSLGVQSIFDQAKANLDKIGDDLFVSEALHNANLDITEAGSTGAASTSVNLETKFPKRIVFVNRPFSFYIIHRPSGVLSFWGTINRPVCNEKMT